VRPIVAGLVLVSGALAQQDLSARLRPISAPFRNAGVYHVATGTWTRDGHLANLIGPSLIYNNSCTPTYFAAQVTGEKWQHRSRVPTTAANGAPTTPSVFYGPPRHDEAPGCDTQYLVDGFQVVYCSSSTQGPITYGFEFANSYAECASLDMVPDHSFAIPGLPQGTSTGQLQCWIVDIDLASTSQAFVLQADGDGTYLGPSTLEQFGWSLGPLSPIGLADATGPVIAGNYTWLGWGGPPVTPCTGTDGTIWDSPVDLTEQGTGMASNNFFRATGSTTTFGAPGCYDFGPNVHSDFYLKLYSAPGCAPPPMVQVCRPGVDPGIIPCPCNNPPAGGGLGCDNFGVGPAQSGTLDATGTASITADTVTLLATGENGFSSSLFWTGKDPLLSGGIPHAAGVRCVTSTLKRLYFGVTNSLGAISRPGTGDPSVSARTAALGSPIVAGETRHYFTVYRDPFASGPCGSSASTLNLTNAGSILWGP
jgi:hypothetical protein